jgi:hypothetical protein
MPGKNRAFLFSGIPDWLVENRNYNQFRQSQVLDQYLFPIDICRLQV